MPRFTCVGKAGAEVEFGSQLLLGEAVSGVIVDWELVDGKPRADTKMLGRSLERMKQMTAGDAIRQVSGDRGFDSAPNRALLENDGIYNGICPKSPAELKKRMKDSEYLELQQRRSQAEARISKGAEAVRTALEMADAFAQLRATAR